MKISHIEKRIVVSIDLDSKNTHRFTDGTTIRVERDYNNFNRRYTMTVNATVISGEGTPEGAEILIHHNATHDTYRVFNYHGLSGEKEADTAKIFSLPEEQCFFYRESPESPWKPVGGYIRAYRVFRPYEGPIENIPPAEIKKTLYIDSGELKGLVCHTLHACDYEIQYMDKGRIASMIRARHYEGENLHDREEIIAISHDLTEQVEQGRLLIGYTPQDAKTIYDHEV
jgi:hypothetical protein